MEQQWEPRLSQEVLGGTPRDIVANCQAYSSRLKDQPLPVELHVSIGTMAEGTISLENAKESRNANIIVQATDSNLFGLVTRNHRHEFKVGDLERSWSTHTAHLVRSIRKIADGDEAVMKELLARSLSLIHKNEAVDITCQDKEDCDRLGDWIDAKWSVAMIQKSFRKNSRIDLALVGKNKTLNQKGVYDMLERERMRGDGDGPDKLFEVLPKLEGEPLLKLEKDLLGGVHVTYHEFSQGSYRATNRTSARLLVHDCESDVISLEQSYQGEGETISHPLSDLQQVGGSPSAHGVTAALLKATASNPAQREAAVSLVFSKMSMDLTCGTKEHARELVLYFSQVRGFTRGAPINRTAALEPSSVVEATEDRKVLGSLGSSLGCVDENQVGGHRSTPVVVAAAAAAIPTLDFAYGSSAVAGPRKTVAVKDRGFGPCSDMNMKLKMERKTSNGGGTDSLIPTFSTRFREGMEAIGKDHLTQLSASSGFGLGLSRGTSNDYPIFSSNSVCSSVLTSKPTAIQQRTWQTNRVNSGAPQATTSGITAESWFRSSPPPSIVTSSVARGETGGENSGPYRQNQQDQRHSIGGGGGGGGGGPRAPDDAPPPYDRVHLYHHSVPMHHGTNGGSGGDGSAGHALQHRRRTMPDEAVRLPAEPVENQRRIWNERPDNPSQQDRPGSHPTWHAPKDAVADDMWRGTTYDSLAGGGMATRSHPRYATGGSRASPALPPDAANGNKGGPGGSGSYASGGAGGSRNYTSGGAGGNGSYASGGDSGGRLDNYTQHFRSTLHSSQPRPEVLGEPRAHRTSAVQDQIAANGGGGAYRSNFIAEDGHLNRHISPMRGSGSGGHVSPMRGEDGGGGYPNPAGGTGGGRRDHRSHAGNARGLPPYQSPKGERAAVAVGGGTVAGAPLRRRKQQVSAAAPFTSPRDIVLSAWEAERAAGPTSPVGKQGERRRFGGIERIEVTTVHKNQTSAAVGRRPHSHSPVDRPPSRGRARGGGKNEHQWHGAREDDEENWTTARTKEDNGSARRRRYHSAVEQERPGLLPSTAADGARRPHLGFGLLLNKGGDKLKHFTSGVAARRGEGGGGEGGRGRDGRGGGGGNDPETGLTPPKHRGNRFLSANTSGVDNFKAEFKAKFSSLPGGGGGGRLRLRRSKSPTGR